MAAGNPPKNTPDRDGDGAAPASGAKSDAFARLLWVDDDRALLRGLKRAVRAYPFIDARFVDSGAEALALLATFRPTAIVLDVQMPGKDGIELLRSLQAHDEGRVIDMVVLSGCADPVLVDAAEQAGVRAYLYKPARLASVLSALGLLPPDVDRPPVGLP